MEFILSPCPIQKPPFPYFGGKRLAAPLIWRGLGDATSYIEPFGGGLACLLARPSAPRREVVNDANAFLMNLWRAMKLAPEEVWYWFDDIASEVDLHARHAWLRAHEQLREKMESDPHFYDAKAAGWWLWGQNLWLASGWCDTSAKRAYRQIPKASPGGRTLKLSDLVALATRLRSVQIVCGDWRRVLTPAYLGKGVKAVMLDPPYRDGAKVYAQHSRSISAEVREWAVEAGKQRDMRIALCGYEGEHVLPKTWRMEAWKARGGFGGASNLNSQRERIWFSPHCVP